MWVETYMRACPKCDTPLRSRLIDKVPCVDIAHNGEDWETARSKIEQSLSRCLEKNYKGLKVIHGRGSEPGHTKIIARKAVPCLKEWAVKLNAKMVRDKFTDGAHLLYF